jgi:hypothetical protein
MNPFTSWLILFLGLTLITALVIEIATENMGDSDD